MNLEKYIEESNKIEGVHSQEAIEDSINAWKYLNGISEIGDLSHKNLKETHKKILENRQPGVAGEYRNCFVRVGDDIPPAPSEVKSLMDDLLERTPETHQECINWHIDFEKIHPFADGNGRIGRMIYWWQCQNLGIEPRLWTAEDREEYYKLF